MHRTIGRVFVALIFTTLANSVSADTIAPGDKVKFADGPGTTGGGEFLVTVNNVEQFITFCLQRTEYIDYSTTFTIGSVSTYALTDPVSKGGNALGQDPISSQTAWLYTQFRANSLAGYDYLGPTRWQSANDLQNAIWWFENEITSNPNNWFVSAANTAVANGWTGVGDVKVINLLFPNRVEAQDQLAIVPSVPEPATLALIGVGIGVAALRRYRQKRRANSDKTNS